MKGLAQLLRVFQRSQSVSVLLRSGLSVSQVANIFDHALDNEYLIDLESRISLTDKGLRLLSESKASHRDVAAGVEGWVKFPVEFVVRKVSIVDPWLPEALPD